MGDVKPYFQDDAVTIYHGDCREIVPTLGLFDSVITDPPYSSGGLFRGDRAQPTSDKYVSTSSVGGCRTEFSGDNLDQRSFLSWAGLWLAQCFTQSNEGASVMLFTDWRQLPCMSDALQHGGWIWRNIVTWWKPGIRMQHGRFSGSSEFVLYGSKGVPAAGERSPQNVLRIAPVHGVDKDHIAEKPVELLRELVGVTVAGAVILDPFAGSGTTGRAAKDLGRKAVLIEREERYCEIAARRMGQEVLDFSAGMEVKDG
jgi:site-specific DNA-methyltransferase (adenine-specific)